MVVGFSVEFVQSRPTVYCFDSAVGPVAYSSWFCRIYMGRLDALTQKQRSLRDLSLVLLVLFFVDRGYCWEVSWGLMGQSGFFVAGYTGPSVHLASSRSQ